MSDLLYDHELLMLIDASPLGIDADSEVESCSLGQLARRGLLRRDALGHHMLTCRGRAVIGANIAPGSRHDQPDQSR